ncbi:uncharacterized protein LOC108143040 [Drosophila elegans]|uniref:uncharacterized protein LOC108143040 n=1 Tax=Drosophila elegans TaxID=30023 RepID=UPI0007E6B617|nr:uncharacterized protein LOC108143040 [Drosophila elegans]
MEQIRVMVQLRDNKSVGEPEKLQESYASNSDQNPTLQHGGQVRILDEHSLQLLYCQDAANPHLLMAQKLHCDVLDPLGEIPLLLNNLFVRRRDAFLMHLRVKRECHMIFLINTLVLDVKTKLKREGLDLDRCIVKFRKLLERKDGNNLQAECSFNILHDLTEWIIHHYSMLSGLRTGPGHEVLEVEYVVSSQERHIQFTVRLSVLLVAMEELSVTSLHGLHCYFRDEHSTSPVVATELLSFMLHVSKRSHGQLPYTAVLVHIMSTNSQVDAQNAELLSLAHFISRQHKNQPENLPSTSAQLNQVEVQQQEVHDRFKLVHDSLMQYIQKAEQLKGYRQRFDDQLAQFEKLLKRTAHTEFGHFLQASQANLDQINKRVLP